MVDNTQYGDVYTIRSDKNMDEILEHLSTGYVLDVMNTELERFLESPFDMNREPPNIVLSFENEFTKFYNDYPTDAENISASRLETYYYILDAFKNIPVVVVKGTSAAKYYPKPQLRTMGDIDIVSELNEYQFTIKCLIFIDKLISIW